MKKGVRVETWKGKRYFVVREKGRIVTYRTYAGSKLTLSQIKEIYKKNNTLRENLKKTVLQHVSEYVDTATTKKDSYYSTKTTKPRQNDAQYVVEGYYGTQHIVGRSHKLGTGFAKTKEQAKAEAWNNFLKALSYTLFSESDADEGLKNIDSVSGLREGWIWYT